MYLTNDRLWDRGEIIGSFHLTSGEQSAMSLVASRGQQLLASPSAGRGKLPQLSDLLLTLALEVVRGRSAGSHLNPHKERNCSVLHLCFVYHLR